METVLRPSRRLKASRPVLTSVVAAVALIAAACSDDAASTAGGEASGQGADASAAPASTTSEVPAPSTEASATTAPATTAPPTTAPPTTEAPVTTAAPTTTVPVMGDREWVKLDGTEDCICGDGSDYSFWVREADPQRVVFYLQGGGACFSAASCSLTDGNFDASVDETDDPRLGGGILDFEDPRNPLADYSFVIAPYCTGDVHVGNAVTPYADDLTIHHNGFVNGTTALAELVRRFGGATEVVVAGSSAGSAASPLYGGLVADELPDASVAVIADASGAYPSVPVVNTTIGTLWGTVTVVPDWPVNEGMTVAEWGLPELFIQAGRHAPRIRFARYDNAFDDSQEFFASLAGFDASRIDQLMAINEEKIEAAGVSQASYTAPGDDHTILLRPEFYTTEVEGVPFLDWITAFISGAEVDDVLCSDCR